MWSTQCNLCSLVYLSESTSNQRPQREAELSGVLHTDGTLRAGSDGRIHDRHVLICGWTSADFFRPKCQADRVARQLIWHLVTGLLQVTISLKFLLRYLPQKIWYMVNKTCRPPGAECCQSCECTILNLDDDDVLKCSSSRPYHTLSSLYQSISNLLGKIKTMVSHIASWIVGKLIRIPIIFIHRIVSRY